ncbi:DUF4112 domain-containing protein [Marivita sp. S0852]|uniref:DUF4112 domain-containing protein n=1 Tax=Marivita sp. S0852 TaxID=3373893 RepID=UPI0039825841
MPVTQTARDLDQKIARLDRLADRLDTRFRIPGTGLRYGWDSILGLVPGIGDLATSGPAAYVVFEAWRMGARKRTLVRMAANSGIDLVIGGVPLFGDMFDLFFKANRRNLALLKSDIARNARQSKETIHG